MTVLGALDVGTLLEHGWALALGLALASTCGLRAFLPLFVLSLLSAFGKVTLGDSFGWLGSPVAAVCFGSATVVEMLGDKFPVVDHALDALGLLVKPVAATLATASMVTDVDPMLAVALGLITGGVAAESVHIAKSKVRLLSTAFTGSLGNPVLSVMEDITAIFAVIMAWLAPVLVVLASALGVFGVWTLWRRRRRREGAAATA